MGAPLERTQIRFMWPVLGGVQHFLRTLGPRLLRPKFFHTGSSETIRPNQFRPAWGTVGSWSRKRRGGGGAPASGPPDRTKGRITGTSRGVRRSSSASPAVSGSRLTFDPSTARIAAQEPEQVRPNQFRPASGIEGGLGFLETVTCPRKRAATVTCRTDPDLDGSIKEATIQILQAAITGQSHNR